MFLGIECERSLYFFTKTNKIRYFAFKLYKHKFFENTIMFLIAISSAKLAVDSYLINYSDDSIQQIVFNNVNICLNVAFLFECVVKIIAMGFFMD